MGGRGPRACVGRRGGADSPRPSARAHSIIINNNINNNNTTIIIIVIIIINNNTSDDDDDDTDSPLCTRTH
eukprot:1506225-Rhodomonas_salina.3